MKKKLKKMIENETAPQEISGKVTEEARRVYREIKENGYLSRTMLEVFEYMLQHETVTGGEVDLVLSHRPGSANHHKRLSDLVRFGVAEEVGKRPCGATDNVVSCFRLTGRMPDVARMRRPKRPPKESIKAALEELRGGGRGSDLRALIVWLEALVEA